MAATMSVMLAGDEQVPPAGGCQTSGVVRVGDTVRRPRGPRSAFVRDLLRFLEQTGFGGAPRFLGVDERDRHVLTFVSGKVLHDDEGYSLADAQLENAAALVRRFHDATAGSRLAGDAEIVAHNDLGPHNTVFVDEGPVAFIDWDDAAPGSRLFDFANAVWAFADVGEHGGSPDSQARRSRLMCDACGWDDAAEIVDEIHADPRRALANHERAGRRKAADVFRGMAGWMEVHAGTVEAKV